jgi:hypothetical protein
MSRGLLKGTFPSVGTELRIALAGPAAYELVGHGSPAGAKMIAASSSSGGKSSDAPAHQAQTNVHCGKAATACNQ